MTITIEQIWLIATMFQIQYGDKTLFELFGCGNSDVKIKEYEFQQNGFNLNLMNGRDDAAWFVLGDFDGYWFAVRRSDNDDTDGNFKYPLSDIVKMLNFEDKV